MSAVEKTPSRLLVIIRSTLFWICFVPETIFFGLFVIACFAMPFSWRYAGKLGWVKTSLFLMRIICGLNYKIEGKENIPDTPVIVFSKHQSAFETIALADIFKPVAWVLKREILWIPIFGWAVALVGPTAINRKAGNRAIDQVVKQGSRSLRNKRWVVIFPEGTRKAPGSPLTYRIGGAVLAAKSGYPVLPVAHNAGEFWSRASLLLWPGTITFCIGPIIRTQDKKPEEILQLAQDAIESRMSQISDPRRWGR